MTELQLDIKSLWDRVLAEIELHVSKAAFFTWFRNTHISKFEEGIVYISVKNAFVRDWISNKYHKTILKILREASDNIRGINYIINTEDEIKQRISPIPKENTAPVAELPFSEFYVDKESNLNSRYTFETFVVGPFNELAHAAAQSILKQPGSLYNPLFVYGSTGHGKTHLIQAIGNYVKTVFLDKKVFYLTSEKFALDYINSIQTNRTNIFKEKYRKYDVLIMDDIQFLSNKEKTQEELFHLFNTLYDNNKQIIFSSDKHPNFIPNLEERLKSRFSAGMIVDIPPPDHESRLAIIRAKIKHNNFTIMDEVVEFLALSLEGNIRELEGIINSIICQTKLKGKELSLIEVKNLVRINSKPKKNISVKDVVKAIAGFYNISEGSIYEKTRKKEIVRPRQFAMYLLREDCNISFPYIGEKLGGRDHTTIIHSCEKIKEELKTNPDLERELNQIRAIL